jgi:hypothetical protein
MQLFLAVQAPDKAMCQQKIPHTAVVVLGLDKRCRYWPFRAVHILGIFGLSLGV